MLNNTFFITGLGRSGTKFLSKILNKSPKYRVIHEWHMPIPGFKDHKMKRFPFFRFVLFSSLFKIQNKGYGEVNSYLRFGLDPAYVGLEKYIEKKAIIKRAPEDVIASVMNRGGRTIQDFPVPP